MTIDNLNRFLVAQETSYTAALREISSGRKKTHWMWYIFPQIKGLGVSETSRYFGIQDLDEAAAFLQHPILGKRLIEISALLLQIQNKSATQILGSPDDVKLRSSMTLFAEVPKTDPVFQQVLDKYFNGQRDTSTLGLLNFAGK